MKRFAAASLGLALCMGGAARAQSPFFQPAAQPIEPVAATAPAIPQAPPGGVVPVRVHFGGALTKDGVVPVPLYLNQPAPMMYTPRAEPAAGIRQVSGQTSGKASTAQPTDNAHAPEVTDPRFVAPNPDDLYRPNRAPSGYRWYVALEYLHYLDVKRQESPPLLLIQGLPVSASDIDANDRAGGRFTIGHWCDTSCVPVALEGVFMFTGTRRSRGTFSSNGVVQLEHPFNDAALDVPDSLPVAIDNDLAPRSGSSEIETASRMWGFEVNARREIMRTCCGHLDFLAGYRQFHLDEAIGIRDQIVFDTAPGPLSGATVNSADEFGTHNTLFAGQVGLEGELHWRGFFVDAWGKFALGANYEVINVSGFTQINGAVLPGALFALPSNIGRYDSCSFTVMPEVGAHVGYAITSNLRVAAGYHFLYLNNVVRPGGAIDPNISTNQIPLLQPQGPIPGGRPLPPQFVESAYWAHGLSVQVEFRY